MSTIEKPAASAHSPLPWRLNGTWNGLMSHENYMVVFDRFLTVSNAEFICRAVNSHDALVAALTAVGRYSVETNTCDGSKVCSMCGMHETAAHQDWCPIPAVTAALAKAEE